jgi:hypothetical protein
MPSALPFCPFHAERYLSGFPHVGVPDMRPAAPAGMLRRQIPRTGLCDGLGPWPYMWPNRFEDIAALAEIYRDLVTLTVMTRPGFRPPAARSDIVPLKPHFLLDPALPAPALSRKTLEHIRRGGKLAVFEPAEDFAARMEMERLYGEVKLRRGLGGFLDFPRTHFDMLARHPDMVFFRARGAGATLAMTCGAMFGDRLQLLHFAASQAGLTQDAGYLLMQGVIDFCRERRLTLMMGGRPDRDGLGIERFKLRWTNRHELVFLARIVNRPDLYAELCRRNADSRWFPAYRAPG